MQAVARVRFPTVRAAASTNSAAPAKTLKALNITKATLIDSNGGRAVRNVDGEIYEVIYQPATDAIKVVCKSEQKEYETEIGKDSRISIILESATAIAGGPPTFQQLQAVLQFAGPGPEAINGRVAMLSLLGAVAAELATGRSFLEQAATPAGAVGAVALSAAVVAASLAPLLLGRVRPDRAFPSVNDSFPDQQLPYFWTALAETINGRVAMVGIAGLIVNELVRGVPLF